MEHVKQRRWDKFARVGLGIFISVAGVGHFLVPDFYVRMITPSLPAPSLLVYISGVAELILALVLLSGCALRFTRWGMIALFVMIFPANIYMAQHPEVFPEFSHMSLLIRLPVQILFLVWTWFATRELKD